MILTCTAALTQIVFHEIQFKRYNGSSKTYRLGNIYPVAGFICLFVLFLGAVLQIFLQRPAILHEIRALSHYNHHPASLDWIVFIRMAHLRQKISSVRLAYSDFFVAWRAMDVFGLVRCRK